MATETASGQVNGWVEANRTVEDTEDIITAAGDETRHGSDGLERFRILVPVEIPTIQVAHS